MLFRSDTTMGTTPLTVAGNEFNVKLHEPLRIDRLSDVYLDSFITFDAEKNNTTGADGKSAFVLSINEFNIQSNSNSSNNLDALVAISM